MKTFEQWLEGNEKPQWHQDLYQAHIKPSQNGNYKDLQQTYLKNYYDIPSDDIIGKLKHAIGSLYPNLLAAAEQNPKIAQELFYMTNVNMNARRRKAQVNPTQSDAPYS